MLIKTELKSNQWNEIETIWCFIQNKARLSLLSSSPWKYIAAKRQSSGIRSVRVFATSSFLGHLVLKIKIKNCTADCTYKQLKQWTMDKSQCIFTRKAMESVTSYKKTKNPISLALCSEFPSRELSTSSTIDHHQVMYSPVSYLEPFFLLSSCNPIYRFDNPPLQYTLL